VAATYGTVVELTYMDRDWYRIGALDTVTTAAYILLALIATTSIEELLLLVSVCRTVMP